MACERYRDTLSDVAAGGPASADVEAHLASCEMCRGELGTLRQALGFVDDEMTRLLAAAPSPDLTARIRTAAAESAAAESGWRLGRRFVLAAAAVVVVAALLVAQRGSQPAPATPATLATDAHPEPPRGTPRATPAREPETTAVSLPPAARAGRSERARTEPEVLVPVGEAEALLRFAAGLQRRAVTSDSLLVADLSAPMPEPKDVFIRPVEIVPLDPDEASGAE
jgi:hypothetical protein